MTLLKILIYGINYTPELIGIGKYSGEMGAWLASQGHEVRVITAPPYYPNWRIWPGYSSWRYSKNVLSGVLVWRCPLYVPKSPGAVLRIIHLISFTLASAPILMAQIFWRPNIVLVILPTLFAAPQALALAALTGAKSVVHIQDYELDAFFGLGLASRLTLISKLRKIAVITEVLILKSFDVVSTISQAMIIKARDKGVKLHRLRFLPNWVETLRFNAFVSESTEFVEQLLGIKSTKKILLYSGNMGEKQGLDLLIQAASMLRDRGDLLFLLVGGGAVEANLKKMVSDLNLSNVIFAPLQSYEDFPRLLSSADVHFVPQKRGVADSVLPSKIASIFAAGGNAIISADESTSLGRMVDENPGLAVLIKPDSVEDLILGINFALTMPRPNMVARNYAEDNLEKERILTRFFDELLLDK